MITEIEDYFTRGCGRCDRFATPECSTQTWAGGLKALRALCQAAGLEEAVRWGHPCYRFADRNIAIIGAFRENFRLSFFEAGLIEDCFGVLERQGPNTAVPDMIRFTSEADVARHADAIADTLAQLKDHARAGRRAPKPAATLDWPEELVAALDDDPELAEAFAALTPGRQKSYVILMNGAKQSATKTARLMRARPKILAGKGAQER